MAVARIDRIGIAVKEECGLRAIEISDVDSIGFIAAKNPKAIRKEDKMAAVREKPRLSMRGVAPARSFVACHRGCRST